VGGVFDLCLALSPSHCYECGGVVVRWHDVRANICDDTASTGGGIISVDIAVVIPCQTRVPLAVQNFTTISGRRKTAIRRLVFFLPFFNSCVVAFKVKVTVARERNAKKTKKNMRFRIWD
jgi:hypothetical protein